MASQKPHGWSVDGKESEKFLPPLVDAFLGPTWPTFVQTAFSSGSLGLLFLDNDLQGADKLDAAVQAFLPTSKIPGKSVAIATRNQRLAGLKSFYA